MMVCVNENDSYRTIISVGVCLLSSQHDVV